MVKMLAVYFFLFGVAMASDTGKFIKGVDLFPKGYNGTIPRNIRSVDFFWRDYNGTVPSDALPTGRNRYIAQILAVKSAANVPGTLNPVTHIAVSMVHGAKITEYLNIKVLCTKEPQRFRWVHVNTANVQGFILNTYIQGGYETAPLYIGRLFHENEWKFGKVFPATSKWRGLNLWLNKGGQYVAHDFEILAFT